MSFDKLKEFIQLAKDEGVKSLEYSNKEEKFEVSFSTSEPTVVKHASVSVAKSPNVNEMEADHSFHEIKSPFVGTFYTAASPTDAPFVKVGSRVSKGQTLCILEAMKIMNEIEADISGEIVEICVENESLVEFGQVLFKVKA